MLAGLTLASLALVLTACGVRETERSVTEAIESNPRNAGVAVVIGTGGSIEQRVLGEIYAQALTAVGYEAKAVADSDAGAATDDDSEPAVDPGSQEIVPVPLREGEIDGYSEDLASALTSLLRLELAEVPRDPQKGFAELQAGLGPLGLAANPPTPFSNANGVALLRERAEELGISKLSELDGVSEDLVLAGPSGCRTAADCLVPLEDDYGLRFERFEMVESGRRFAVLDRGVADLSIVSRTDAELAESETYAILEDDRDAMPAGNVVLILNEETVERAGEDLETTIELVQESLTDEVMRVLEARVEIDGEAPAGAARQYLVEAGLIG